MMGGERQTENTAHVRDRIQCVLGPVCLNYTFVNLPVREPKCREVPNNKTVLLLTEAPGK